MRLRSTASITACFVLSILAIAGTKSEGQDLSKVDLAMLQHRADAGDAGAQLQLGLDYSGGLGVARDYVQALLYFRKAADQGNAAAQI